MSEMFPFSDVSKRIYFLRDYPVMLDYDLAKIYQVENRDLKKAVRRNLERSNQTSCLSQRRANSNCLSAKLEH